MKINASSGWGVTSWECYTVISAPSGWSVTR